MTRDTQTHPCHPWVLHGWGHPAWKCHSMARDTQTHPCHPWVPSGWGHPAWPCHPIAGDTQTHPCFPMGAQCLGTLRPIHVTHTFSMARDTQTLPCHPWVLCDQGHPVSSMSPMGAQWLGTPCLAVPPHSRGHPDPSMTPYGCSMAGDTPSLAVPPHGKGHPAPDTLPMGAHHHCHPSWPCHPTSGDPTVPFSPQTCWWAPSGWTRPWCTGGCCQLGGVPGGVSPGGCPRGVPDTLSPGAAPSSTPAPRSASSPPCSTPRNAAVSWPPATTSPGG